MGFAEVLTLLLVAAKLFGFAHYGWLVALSPLLVVDGFIVLIAIAALVVKALS